MTREHGMLAVGSYLPCQLRAGELHRGSNNNSIEKGYHEKQEWGDNTHKQTHWYGLGVALFAGRYGSNRPLTP